MASTPGPVRIVVVKIPPYIAKELRPQLERSGALYLPPEAGTVAATSGWIQLLYSMPSRVLRELAERHGGEGTLACQQAVWQAVVDSIRERAAAAGAPVH